MVIAELVAGAAYIQLGTALTVAVVQGSGDVEISYTGVGAGFTLPSGTPVSVPELATLGGNLFARTVRGGAIRYETA